MPVVPQNSTFEQQGNILAYKVNNENKVSTVKIGTKATVGNLYIVESGLKEGDVTSILSCGHMFHHDCIKEWCHYKAVCPLCKKNIPLTKENLTSDKDNVEQVKKTKKNLIKKTKICCSAWW